MAKYPTYPTLYDSCKTVSISFLNKHGYLKQCQSGTITWSKNGNKIGAISIRANTHHENPYIELDYRYGETPVNYKVNLVSIPSNIGKGVLWFFICPHTGKRCRKLFQVGESFLHRSAFRGCMYEKQTQSKKSRYIDKMLGDYFNSDKYYEQLYKKHFKKQYAGKPTKEYLRLMEQIEKAEQIHPSVIERLMMS